MISALAIGVALSGLLLAVVHALVQPRPVPIRIRDARSRRAPDA